MYSNDEKTDMMLIYGECNKNASAVARFCRQLKFSQKLFIFSQFHLTKQIKKHIHVNFGNVLWVAFSITSASLSLVKHAVFLKRTYVSNPRIYIGTTA
jgi:hypothetical protein